MADIIDPAYIKAGTVEGDLISRQAAIDAISCDITVTGIQNAELVAATIGTFADRIKALPSAKPEIIHCKDCAHYGGYGFCYEVDGLWYDEDYCSRAERRSDGQTD